MNQKALILVVDDDQNFLDISTVRLEAGGYRVATADNPEEGIQKAEELLPDLILMDINMPGSAGGTDAALTLKENPKTKDIKIAFLSSLKKPFPAFSTGDRENVSRELGMEHFLDKGEDIEHLAQKVGEILDQSA